MTMVAPNGSEDRIRARKILHASARANAEDGCPRKRWKERIVKYAPQLVAAVGFVELERIANCVAWPSGGT
jgi:hypothetical protein